MNYLGLDYGTKHIGIAIAITPLAQPLETIDISIIDQRLPQLIQTHQVDQIVVGISEGHMAELTKAFVKDLEATYNLPVYTHDETLSSQEAVSKLRHSKKKKRRGPDHHYAAALILQDFLDSTQA